MTEPHDGSPGDRPRRRAWLVRLVALALAVVTGAAIVLASIRPTNEKAAADRRTRC